MPKSLRIALLPAALALVVGLSSGCSGTAGDSDLKDAEASLRAGDTKSALIRIKSAIQRDPESLPARLMLAEALIEAGDGELALVELKKARSSHPQSQNATVPLLARAMLLTNRHQQLIDELGSLQLTDATSSASLQAALSMANFSKGHTEAAKRTAAKSLEAVPNFADALLAQSDIALAAGNTDEAKALIEKVISSQPKNAYAWLRLGVLKAQRKHDFTGAIEAFRKSLEANPSLQRARSNLIFLLLGQGDTEAATKELKAFKVVLPNHPQTGYFEAQLEYKNNNKKKALEIIEKVLQATPDNAPALQLAGSLQFAERQYLKAERSLNRALSIDPSLITARQDLAQVYLKMGRAEAALGVIKPLLDENSNNASAHYLAGEANLLLGNFEGSIASLSTAAKLDPKNVNIRTQLTLAKARSLGLKSTAEELKRIAADDKGTTADLALVSLHIQTQDFERALAAIDNLATKLPKSALPLTLRGIVHAKSENLLAARKSFEQALALDKSSTAAIVGLADLDVRESKPPDAIKRLESAITTDPTDYVAIVELAKINKRLNGKRAEIERLLTNAIRLRPNLPEPRILQINHYLSLHDSKSAIARSKEAVLALPTDPDIIDALARSLIAGGEVNQAISAYGKLITIYPQSPYAHLRMAAAFLSANDKVSAEKSLKRSLDFVPDFIPAQEALIKMALLDKRHADAIKIARTIQKQRLDQPDGLVIEGDIEGHRGNGARRLELYQQALKQFRSTRVAMKLYLTLSTSGQPAEAEKMAAAWITANPKDRAFLAYAGDLAVAVRDHRSSERYFRELLALEPENAAALNNVAWAMANLKKPGAVEFSERAVKLRPGSAGLLDTFAYALAAEGHHDRALEQQKRALEITPNDMGLRLNLAKIYVLKGSKDAARVELEALAKLGDKFPAAAEVKELLKAL